MKHDADYLKPWITGDRQGQFDTGRREGYEAGLKSWGYPDGPLEETDWGRGYIKGYEEAQKIVKPLG
jgi:hypothetical protein